MPLFWIFVVLLLVPVVAAGLVGAKVLAAVLGLGLVLTVVATRATRR